MRCHHSRVLTTSTSPASVSTRAPKARPPSSSPSSPPPPPRRRRRARPPPPLSPPPPPRHLATNASVGRKCHTLRPVHCRCHVPSCLRVRGWHTHKVGGRAQRGTTRASAGARAFARGLYVRRPHFCNVLACSTASVCSGLPASGSRPATRPKKTHTALACATASRTDGARAARDDAKHAGSSASGIVARNAASCALPPDGCTTKDAYQRSSSASSLVRRRLRGAGRPSTSTASRFIPFSQVHVPATIFGAASKALRSCTSGSAHHPPALEGESAPRISTSWCLSYRRRKWAAVGGVCSSHSGGVDEAMGRVLGDVLGGRAAALRPRVGLWARQHGAKPFKSTPSAKQ